MRDWLTPEQVKALYGINRHRLGVWGRKRCPALGRKVRTMPNPSRPGKLYLRADVELGLPHEPTDEFQDDAGHWLHIRRAAREYHVSNETLTGWRLRGCPFLGGRKIASCRRKFIGTYRDFVRREDLDAIAAARLVWNKSSDWLTADEARSLLGLYPQRLSMWRRHGCPHLRGRKLTARLVRIADARGYLRQTWQYRRTELERIAAPVA